MSQSPNDYINNGATTEGRDRPDEADGLAERYRLLAENMTDVVCQIGPQGEIVFVSPSVRPALGHNAPDIQGKSVYEFLHPEDRERAEADYVRFSRTGTIEDLEYRVLHANGEYRWMEVRARPVFDREFIPAGVVIAARDITRHRETAGEMELLRRQADENLGRRLEDLARTIGQLRDEIAQRKTADREQADRLKRQEAIARVMPVVLYSAQLGTPFAAVWMSENVGFVTGFPLERFLNEPGFWMERVHPDDRETVEEYLKLASTGKIQQTEYRWMCADGEYHWFLDQVVNVQLNEENVTEYFGLWMDITGRQDINRKIKPAPEG
jgi:PAS domain S-box-containing protein